MKQKKCQKVKIKIKNSQRKITINKKTITRLAKQILKIKNEDDTELSIVFVGKYQMRRLNRQFRKIDRPTDVLAFSMREAKRTSPDPQILGDVVMCPEIAQRFARIYKNTLREEICLCLIHGILHLLGYADSDKSSRMLMEKEQKKILKKLT